MRYYTHLAFAFLLSLVSLHHIGPGSRGGEEHVIPYVLLALVGSLAPDADEARSKLGRRLRPVQILLKHRGAVHSLFFLVALSLGLRVFMPAWAVMAFAAGFISHLLLDALTPEGVRMFWPMKKRFRGVIKTGSFAESILLFAFIILSAAYMYWTI